MSIQNQELQALQGMVGAQAVLTAEEDIRPHAVDWRRYYNGRPLAVVKPASTAEVAAVMRWCAAQRVAVVPQGGNTGLVGGATPDASGRQLVLNLSRMNKVRAIDLVNNTMTVEAGCVLTTLQQKAREAGRLFPLSLASEGSCEIGGNLSTNAGGTAVLRYGNTRELTLGLEVVLASGEVWNGLRGLRKDNTGYDLKHLFIGAEGTLGVITAAVLKLFPLPQGRATAIVALQTPQRALQLLTQLQERCNERLTGFELFSDLCLELVLRHFPRHRAPLPARHPQYVLVELSDSQPAAAVGELLESALAPAIESGLIVDVAMASSESQAQDFWGLRENVSEAQSAEGRNIKHDVSVPISDIGRFIEVADAELQKTMPGVRNVTFGHLGDGNLHYNISPPAGEAPEAFMGKAALLNKVVHDIVVQFGGSISAEHGLGQLKRDEIRRYKSEVELGMMRSVKAALDPHGLMNPGKIL